ACTAVSAVGAVVSVVAAIIAAVVVAAAVGAVAVVVVAARVGRAAARVVDGPEDHDRRGQAGAAGAVAQGGDGHQGVHADAFGLPAAGVGRGGELRDRLGAVEHLDHRHVGEVADRDLERDVGTRLDRGIVL